MTISRLFKPLTLPLAGLALAACGSGATSEYDPVATGLAGLMADADAGEARAFHDLLVSWNGEQVTGLALDANGVLKVTRRGLDFSLDLDCKDNNGNTVTKCEGKNEADAKITWKGTVEDAKYKYEIDRRAQLKLTVLDETKVRIEGDVDYTIKSDFKDRIEDYRHKYSFDADAKYDVVVSRTDGTIISGNLTADIDAKEKIQEDDSQIKSQIKTKVTVEFLGGVDAEVDFDSKTKYSVKLDNGEIEIK